MRLDFFDRRSAERFAELLDENDGSHGQHIRGQADDQLAELVAIGHSLSAARPGAQVDPEFRTGLRAMLVAAAERDGIGVTAPVAEEPAATAPVRKLFGLTSRRLRARGVIVVGVAASAMAVSGISAASESAAPGDALYGVKRSTERAQLAMAGSDLTRGQLSLTFARNRLTEAAAMTGDDAKFRAALDDMDADTKHGVKLLTTGAVTSRDPAGLDSVDSFTSNQRRLMTPALNRLGPVNQERAGESLTLLDTVDKRSGNLRERLNCEPVPAASGSDALGPKLSPCGGGSDKQSAGAATEKQQGGRDSGSTRSPGAATSTKDSPKGDTAEEPQDGTPTARPGTTSRTPVGSDPTDTDEPAADDSDSGAGSSDDADDSEAPTGASTAEESPEPLISEDPANPPTDEEKGLLGGLLGNLFGNK